MKKLCSLEIFAYRIKSSMKQKIYFIVLKLIIFGVWRDNPVDKITGSSSRGP